MAEPKVVDVRPYVGTRTTTTVQGKPPPPLLKTSDIQKVDDLAIMLVTELENRARVLGRPLEPADLEDDFLRAFGLEMWKKGTPVTVEDMRRVAAVYIEGNKVRGFQKDDRWRPNL